MMKKFTSLFLLFTASILLSCNTENLEENTLTNEIPNFTVTENTNNFQLRSTSCVTADLIAGQNMIAGSVTVDFSDTDIIITYTTNSDWIIDLTHLSLGDCEDKWVPTTGSGNPKVGKFEHTEPHIIGTNEVVYEISLDLLETNAEGNYCFAAHAEVSSVSGGGGETAWADGADFDGNNWAMYVEAELGVCDSDDDVTQPPVSK